MSGNFDPDSFMNMETTTANADKYEPIPAGEYQALIKDVEARMSQNNNPMLVVTYDVLDDALKEKMNMQNLTVRQTIVLDLDDNGALSEGTNKNVRLGKLRSAVGQNESGKPWNPNMLKGAGPVTLSISQRPNDDDPDIVYNQVDRVSKAA